MMYIPGKAFVYELLLPSVNPGSDV